MPDAAHNEMITFERYCAALTTLIDCGNTLAQAARNEARLLSSPETEFTERAITAWERNVAAVMRGLIDAERRQP